jgi:hypothetical protein
MYRKLASVFVSLFSRGFKISRVALQISGVVLLLVVTHQARTN